MIGSGTTFMAQDFAQQHGVPFRLLVDPDLSAYAAANLKRGISTIMGLGPLRAGVRAYSAGFRQGPVAGDPLQQGGVLVIAAGGNVVYAQVSESAGDHADEASIVAAAHNAAALSSAPAQAAAQRLKGRRAG